MTISFDLHKRVGNFELTAAASLSKGITGVFGPSGSGKTTLLHCLAGFIKPDAGEIRIDDRILFSAKERIHAPIEQRRTGMVFQDALLFPHMSVKENIFYGRGKEAPQKFVDEVVDVLDLYRLIERRPGNLSGGERQRAALARTLIHQPAVLLMDEPLSSLDNRSRYQIVSYIRRVHLSFKIPVVYVSHTVSEMLFLSDEVLVLENGRVKGQGIPGEWLLPAVAFDEEVENIFDLPVKSIDRDSGLAVLDLNGFSLKVTYSDGQIRPRLRVGLRAADPIVAVSPIQGVSARNVVPATIMHITEIRNNCLLSVNIHGKICLVEVTRQARTEMELMQGKAVYLIIKAGSFVVLD